MSGLHERRGLIKLGLDGDVEEGDGFMTSGDDSGSRDGGCHSQKPQQENKGSRNLGHCWSDVGGDLRRVKRGIEGTIKK